MRWVDREEGRTFVLIAVSLIIRRLCEGANGSPHHASVINELALRAFSRHPAPGAVQIHVIVLIHFHSSFFRLTIAAVVQRYISQGFLTGTRPKTSLWIKPASTEAQSTTRLSKSLMTATPPCKQRSCGLMGWKEEHRSLLPIAGSNTRDERLSLSPSSTLQRHANRFHKRADQSMPLESKLCVRYLTSGLESEIRHLPPTPQPCTHVLQHSLPQSTNPTPPTARLLPPSATVPLSPSENLAASFSRDTSRNVHLCTAVLLVVLQLTGRATCAAWLYQKSA